MIKADFFIAALKRRGMEFFTGVPDSNLKNLGPALARLPANRHVIAANEGNAVGLAIGHYLATGRPPVVYMQNSGLGNTVNPLTSLADPEVYAIPMLLVVGWRGEPGVKDEPQHVKMGRISPDLLNVLEIPFRVIDGEADIEEELNQIWPMSGRIPEGPAALLIRGDTFAPEPDVPVVVPGLSREEALECILDGLTPSDSLVATTGKTGRELFELRKKRGQDNIDFLTVGGMGHGSSIALGAALARPEKRLICLDGDGALVMHLGAMGIIGQAGAENMVHILMNNRCHESVGGQPTCAGGLDFQSLALGCGYAGYLSASTSNDITMAMSLIQGRPGPHFMEIIIRPGSRRDLGRPTATTLENKERFMKHLWQ